MTMTTETNTKEEPSALRRVMATMLFFALFFILVFTPWLGFKAIKEFKSDGGVCQQNPFIFGAKKLNEVNEDVFSCSCTALRKEGILRFNAENASIDLPERSNNPQLPKNFSSIKLS